MATSAMIKSLRRGRELDAYYWARQVERRFPRYVWRRLAAFAAEDVGLGNPTACLVVEANRRAYETDRSESSAPMPDRSYLAMTVLVLARSDKSREADDLLNAEEYLRGWGWAAQVPAEALDLHTAPGRERLPRSQRMRHWLEHAQVVVPRVGPLDWRLWILRWAAHRGLLSVEWVDQLAARWDDSGRLVHGREGYPEARFDWRDVQPEFPEIRFEDPEDDERWR